MGVTRRKHRADSRYFSQKIVTVQGGDGALFAVQVQSFVSITSVAVKVRSEPENYHRLQVWLRALERSRYKQLRICLGCRGKSKKCDKPINYTVRVSLRLFFNQVTEYLFYRYSLNLVLRIY